MTNAGALECSPAFWAFQNLDESPFVMAAGSKKLFNQIC